MNIFEKQQRGNRKGDKLMTSPLPFATMRGLIKSQVKDDIQLSQEAIEVSREFWQGEIERWAKGFLFKELEAVNSNPNRTKPSSYKYRRITGLMALRAIRKFTKRGCNDG
jgi:hypothetical protein